VLSSDIDSDAAPLLPQVIRAGFRGICTKDSLRLLRPAARGIDAKWYVPTRTTDD